MAVLFLLAAGSRAAAQTRAEQIDFDSPEAWALKYFSAVTTFTAIGPPVLREAGSIDFGLEGGWIPRLSDSQRRVGFSGTELEDLNKVAVYGRPRLTVGLPGGFSVEAAGSPRSGSTGNERTSSPRRSNGPSSSPIRGPSESVSTGSSATRKAISRARKTSSLIRRVPPETPRAATCARRIPPR